MLKENEPKKITSKEENLIKTNVTSETVFYIGASIPGVVHKNTTFRNGIPESIKKMIVSNPVIQPLFVTAKALPQALSDLEHEAGYVYECYKKIEKQSK